MDELGARRDALRQAATAPGADLRSLLDAALTELDGAIDSLVGAEVVPAGRTSDALQAERRLLHAAFQQAPVALFLLTADGTVRRANGEAAALLGAPVGYATGKSLTVFVDPPQRAAVQTQLAAVTRTGTPRQIACRLLTSDGPAEVTLGATGVDLPGEPPLLAATVAPVRPRRGPREKPKPARTEPDQDQAEPDQAPGNGRRVTTQARRLDMVTAVARLLLDNSTFSEAVTLRRCARLLAGELADWAIVDVARDDRLRRLVVAGPRGPEADQAAREVRDVDPGPSTLIWQVHESAKSALHAHVSDPAALGAVADGTPQLLRMRATSLLVVPVSDRADRYGTLTLARSASSGHFTVADLALAEDLAGHLAIALRTDQMFRRRSQMAETLQASLLQGRLPEVPGLEVAASAVSATSWQEVSGDFYDVFRTPSGWAVAIGDVCGTGHEAAAMAAAARHSIRALTHVHGDPSDVLAAGSEVLLAGDHGELFVTAMLAFPRTRRGGCTVRLATAGHPGPAVVRADGRVEIISAGALPLGLLPDARPDAADLELETGDLVFFYTNGVTQACSEDREFFEDRLVDALAETAGRSAAETVHAVTERLTDFCHDEFRDDAMMLAMRVR